MSTSNKVVWTEGMFLRPQHFQQQERYFEAFVEGRVRAARPYFWGFEDLEIDTQLLKLGKISVNRCKLVLPDGTPVQVPEVDAAPVALDVPANTRNKIVYLVLPVRRQGALDVQTDASQQSLTRYLATEKTLMDTVTGEGDDAPILIGQLQLTLLLETEDLSGFIKLGMLRIKESADDGSITLDDTYIPPLSNCHAHPTLHGFLNELSGLLNQRAETLAARLKESGRAGSAEISDYLLLQLLNRLQPTAECLMQSTLLHPYDMFLQMIQMGGELSTFTSTDRRPTRFPAYLHEDLATIFSPVIGELRKSLSTVLEQSAIALELAERKYGIHVSPINDRSLVEKASFVLAVKASVSPDQLRVSFPSQIKIAPVEKIRELINAQLPGIGIQALPVAPRQLPYHSGFTYFQLDRNSEFWRTLLQSGGFAIHVGGDFPGLEMEFWAIRD
jgi:type VI secretion system protein ImpJ